MAITDEIIGGSQLMGRHVPGLSPKFTPMVIIIVKNKPPAYLCQSLLAQFCMTVCMPKQHS